MFFDAPLSLTILATNITKIIMAWIEQQILIGIDGSEGSNRAAEVGAEMASHFGSKITLLYVATSSDSPRYSAKPTYTPTQEIIVGEKLEIAKKILEEKKVGFDIAIEMGDPAEKTLLCSQDGFGMIILGTKGTSTLRDSLLGRVSTKVVNSSNVPVMIVP